jgi:mannose-6-phosphate isomerase-like protein (cupin superfamily)
MTDSMPMTTVHLPIDHDVLAPDGSEIRILAGTARASMAHGLLPPGGVSRAIRHQTVEEIWYVLAGRAEIWRRLGNDEQVVEATAGTSLTIPVGAAFQFRTVGDEPFQFIMLTMPPWPGSDEAIFVDGRWDAANAEPRSP